MIEMQPGNLYLGKEPDHSGSPSKTYTLESSGLVTHGVVLGMTGSGKTGLGIGILEEILLNRIPVIIIDCKGDMANLPLQFPQMKPEFFSPWISPREASAKNKTPEEYAEEIARNWEKNLKEWDIDGNRIEKLKSKVNFRIFTPGASTINPVNLLDSFKVPVIVEKDNSDAFADTVESTAMSVLSLLGIKGDPLQSREYILLSNILKDRWNAQEDLNIESLINYIFNPPMKKLGFIDVENAYPKDERAKLAMLINNLAASPGFSSWRQGEGMDISKMIALPDGATPCSVFYLSHLPENERLFFVTLLLDRLMNHFRRLSGTSRLRCLLYFDEVFGFLPPHPASPSSKKPILTILKQARAFGLGMILATQNPVDIDYKALSNIGTWFIGRLHTDQDRKRLLDNISVNGTGLDKKQWEHIISNLNNRDFMVKTPGADITVFKTRNTQAFLPGPIPLARLKEIPGIFREDPAEDRFSPAQIKTETPPKTEDSPEIAPPQEKTGGSSRILPDMGSILENMFLKREALKDREIGNFLFEYRTEKESNCYIPMLISRVRLRFDDKKAGLLQYRDVAFLTPPLEEVSMPHWSHEELEIHENLISCTPTEDLPYCELPSYILNKNRLEKLKEDLLDNLFRNKAIHIFENPSLKMYSKFDESREDFENRCAGETEGRMNTEKRESRKKFERKIDTLRNKAERLKNRKNDYEKDLDARKRDEWISAGESVLNMFMGKKRVGRALSTASSKRRMTESSKNRIESMEIEIQQIEDEILKIENEMDDTLEEITESYRKRVSHIEELPVTLDKNDIKIRDFGILWVPL